LKQREEMDHWGSIFNFEGYSSDVREKTFPPVTKIKHFMLLEEIMDVHYYNYTEQIKISEV